MVVVVVVVVVVECLIARGRGDQMSLIESGFRGENRVPPGLIVREV